MFEPVKSRLRRRQADWEIHEKEVGHSTPRTKPESAQPDQFSCPRLMRIATNQELQELASQRMVVIVEESPRIFSSEFRVYSSHSRAIFCLKTAQRLRWIWNGSSNTTG